MTLRYLAIPLHSLRPILHITYPKSMLSCSKGSRGLSVPLRVIGIFTDTTISPSSWLRQCPDRYTIRAGRNLPDKEFHIRHLSIWHSHVFLLNSRLGHFSAPHTSLHGVPLSRSYRVNLPSSLAMNHSSALVYSTQLRVSVYSTSRYTRFSWKGLLIFASAEA